MNLAITSAKMIEGIGIVLGGWRGAVAEARIIGAIRRKRSEMGNQPRNMKDDAGKPCSSRTTGASGGPASR